VGKSKLVSCKKGYSIILLAECGITTQKCTAILYSLCKFRTSPPSPPFHETCLTVHAENDKVLVISHEK